MLTLLRDAITNVKRTVTFVIARSARKLGAYDHAHYVCIEREEFKIWFAVMKPSYKRCAGTLSRVVKNSAS